MLVPSLFFASVHLSIPFLSLFFFYVGSDFSSAKDDPLSFSSSFVVLFFLSGFASLGFFSPSVTSHLPSSNKQV